MLQKTTTKKQSIQVKGEYSDIMVQLMYYFSCPHWVQTRASTLSLIHTFYDQHVSHLLMALFNTIMVMCSYCNHMNSVSHASSYHACIKTEHTRKYYRVKVLPLEWQNSVHTFSFSSIHEGHTANTRMCQL